MSTISSISLVIPVYNEEDNLPILYREIATALERVEKTAEILLVDDGSKDRSLDVIKALADGDARVRFLAFAENRGQSAAFAAGFQHAAGDVIVTMDSDLQNDPADIPALLATYEQGHDMVIGWRANRKDTWVKRMTSKIGNAIRNRISRETVKDTGCSLKVMRADMARRIPMFNGMHRFLPTLMKLQGARVAEVAVNHRPRVHGRSKYGVLDRAMTTWYDLIAVRWMQLRYIDYRIKEKN
ncbi:MAG: glycosyltransferase family 2 protein [Desulfovibrionaceae bacterium]|jgi:glycosyltransferase involved in cell wall biosynthesis|nr:glycosyltransferase family 2 protein [Desulfovibrionaceae bacterium]